MTTPYDAAKRAPVAWFIGASVLALSLGVNPAPAVPDVERSALFTLTAGDRVEDAGVFRVASGRFARTEAFEVVRRADGGRTLTSVIRGQGDTYRVEGRWEYDAQENALRSEGLGSYPTGPVKVSITAAPPEATIRVSLESEERALTASCEPDCLIDMAPSAVAMFAMTRRHSGKPGETQTFRWIGQALTVDQVLLEGEADIKLLRTAAMDGIQVRQFTFVEALKNAVTGEISSFAFNLWVDAAHRPLAFATEGGTQGQRDGFEQVLEKMPPLFD